jgi:hypothetical protein
MAFRIDLFIYRGGLCFPDNFSLGMFLYAKVVLDNLFSQDSPAEFKDKIASDIFPADLEKAYEPSAIFIRFR